VGELLLRVAEEREGDPVLLGELLLSGGRVGTGPEHAHAQAHNAGSASRKSQVSVVQPGVLAFG